MTPQTRKVILITGVSLGIIAFSFLVPTVIFPLVSSVQSSATCWNTGCTGTTYQKCVGSQGNNTSAAPLDFMTNGVKGLMCMMGPAHVDAYHYSVPILNSEIRPANLS